MNILVLTGAGISAESGIPTFRDADGLWEGHAVEEVATPQGFARDPDLVHQFYTARRRSLLSPSICPNAAHIALAEWEREHTAKSVGDFLLVTQNIDDLHARAGSANVLAMHGELLKVRCVESGKLFDWRDDLSVDTPHPDFPDDESRRGWLRPHVVWFGEVPLGLDQIAQAASQADLFLAVGTSGLVYPAAGIVQSTKPSCRKIEINLGDTPASPAFDEHRRGQASVEVPKLIRELEDAARGEGR
ncbi:SIR2 family NAD-dependent protein deacylase [Allorhodopirellula solitaria]|uniref:NAD-dependent protein deacylase n=1 Tax=Allorhodopirellula solitaria TaxID=2527987 RepID=A0A5C5WXR4_9BACT|nr:NAD-dependent deacylase [Allorhodopirellula solitaria]TWT55360.1 NAD-dependent protein deacylase [Allorhodopirellula solitaria]